MNNIKNISLLLSRMGTEISYFCSVLLYECDQYGVPVGLPLGISYKDAIDIGFKDYYNFAFDPVIITEKNNLTIILTQSINDNINFIQWHCSEMSLDSYGYAISSGFYWGDAYAYSYGYMYGYGYNTDGIDFFDVFDVDDSGYGYCFDYGPESEHIGGGYEYGFERMLFQSNPYVQREFKVYDDFNNIVYSSENRNIYIELPPSSEESIVYDERQEFYNGYKNNIEITDNKIVLKDVGKRICFHDMSDEFPIWKATNRNLDVCVHDFAILNGDDQYSCDFIAAAERGLYYSANSGGDWSKISTVLNKCVLVSSYNIPQELSGALPDPKSGEFIFIEEENDKFYVYKGTITAGEFSKEDVLDNTGDPVIIDDDIPICLYYGFCRPPGLYDGISLIIVGCHNHYYIIGINTGGPNYYYALEDIDHVNSVYAYCDTLIYLCSNDGLYSLENVFRSLVVTLLEGTHDQGHVTSYCVFDSKNYVGTENGLFLYENEELIGNNPSSTNYLVNINRSYINNIISSNEYVFVAEDCGIYCSKNGIIFELIANGLNPDLNVIKLINNPIEHRMIHALTKTIKNKIPYITFIIDTSGSMFLYNDGESYKKYVYGYGYSYGYASEYNYNNIIDFFDVFDENGSLYGYSQYGIDISYGYGYSYGYEQQYETHKTQYDLLAEIGDAINVSYLEVEEGEGTTPLTSTKLGVRCEVITFSTTLPDAFNLSILQRENPDINMNGATNETFGFIPWSTPGDEATYADNIKALVPSQMGKTPLYETLWASLIGAYNDGSNWFYVKDTDAPAPVGLDINQYNFDTYENKLFQESSKIVILLTDGRDTISFKTIEQIINSSNYYSIKNNNAKFYIIAYGEHCNLGLFRKIKNDNTEVLYSRSGNLDDFNRIKDYIVLKEKGRLRSGIYKKTFYSKEEILASNIEIDVTISEVTTVQLRFRTSMNKYELGSFPLFYTTLNNGNNIISVDTRLKFLEIEIKLESYDVNDSPSINSITIKHRKPTHNYLVFNAFDNAFKNRLDQMEISPNVFFYEYGNNGYDYYHMYNQQSKNKMFYVKPLFGASRSIHPEIFENIQLDKRSIMDRRNGERTTTTDFITYNIANGPWDMVQDITVYINKIKASESSYFARPEKGQIVFNEIRNTSDKITIDINVGDKFRLAFDIVNYSETNTFCALHDMNIEYNDEKDTQSERSALPLTPSQMDPESNIAWKTYSKIIGCTNYIVAGQLGFLYCSYLIAKDIPLNSYILFGLGEVVESVGYDPIFKSHQGQWIFGDLQMSSSSTNYFNVSCNKTAAQFDVIINNGDGLILAKYTGGAGDSLKRNDQINFAIGGIYPDGEGFDSNIYNHSSIDYLKNVGCPASIHTYACVSIEASDAIVPTDKTQEKIDKLVGKMKPSKQPISFIANPAALNINVIVPSTSDSTTFDLCLSKTDVNGILCENISDDFALTFINLATSATTPYSNIITMTPEDKGIIKTSIQAPSIGMFKIVVTDSNLVTKRSNAININYGYNILWGDLNAKSSFGSGRQSPSFIYEYARDVAGLDFCCIADPSFISNDDWGRYKIITDYYNVRDEFCTLCGIEWQGLNNDFCEGIRTIVCKTLNGLSNSEINGVAKLTDLYGCFVGNNNVLFFANNPAYSKDNPTTKKYNVDWYTLSGSYNPVLERAIEIYSEHGHSETLSGPAAMRYSDPNSLKYPVGLSGHSYANDALYYGYKFGFVANSNGPCSRPGLYFGELNRTNLPDSNGECSITNNRGITAVLTSNFTSDGIFDAIYNRKTYATTGARIYIEFRISNTPMGGEIEIREIGDSPPYSLFPPLAFHIKVVPANSHNATVQLVRIVPGEQANRFDVINAFQAPTTNNIYSDSTLINIKKDAVYYVRVLQTDGHMAWTSPIYVKYIKA